MNLNDLLAKQEIDPTRVIALRHRPSELELRKVLPWLAAERPAVYNAYQQTQTGRLEASMQRASHIASFIGHQPARGLFVGLYAVAAFTPILRRELRARPEWLELKRLGHRGVDECDRPVVWFDLADRLLFGMDR